MKSRACGTEIAATVRIASAALLVLVMFALPSELSGGSTEASQPNLRIGDYWEYSFLTSDGVLSTQGTITMTIEEVEEMNIGGIVQEVFVVTSTGEAEVSGLIEGVEAVGSAIVGANELRLSGNFDVVESDAWAFISFTYGNLTENNGIGYEMRFEPAFDDYVGDEILEVGTVIADSSDVSGELWIETNGVKEYQTIDSEVEYTLDLTSSNITRSTPAGTFSCCEIQVASWSASGQSDGTNCFSEEVGNYVTMEAGSAYYNGLFGDLTLVSYSYNPDGVPPVADAGGALSVKEGESFTLNGTASYDNVGIVNYTWDLMKDGVVVYLYGPDPGLTLEEKGEYIINLTVCDAAGNSDSDSTVVTVRSGGVLSYLTGSNTWVGVLAIVIAAFAVGAAAVVRWRRGSRDNPSSEESKTSGSPIDDGDIAQNGKDDGV